MKVNLEIDPDAKETIITIRSREMNEFVLQLYRMLGNQQKEALTEVVGHRGEQTYYLELTDILFFEAETRHIMAHTKDTSYQTNYKLYQLEKTLPTNYLRVSKSAIINTLQIFSIKKSSSDCLIEFKDSYKTLYVSRRYYAKLKQTLDERRKSL
ncbi:MAG: LytTR family transcriptional regulator [Lactobacillus sp.]|nr:LytTR family transcriptional regulator [Lactobacillus sp.]MDN6053294.1 LytTR family transcriptional regulator [Lactobacillus sp.]